MNLADRVLIIISKILSSKKLTDKEKEDKIKQQIKLWKENGNIKES